MDYGTINPCSIGLWCVTRERAVRVKEYYYDSRKKQRQRTDEEHYTELEKLADGHRIRYVVCDPSAASFIATVKRHNKFYIKKAKNDVLDGIRVTSELLNNNKAVISDKCEDSKEDYLMWRYGVTEEQAKEMLPKTEGVDSYFDKMELR